MRSGSWLFLSRVGPGAWGAARDDTIQSHFELIGFLRQRFIGCTNGRLRRAAGLSPRAQLVQAGGLLVLAFMVMEPASAFGLAWW
jgi:hypothetical protein